MMLTLHVRVFCRDVCVGVLPKCPKSPFMECMLTVMLTLCVCVCAAQVSQVSLHGVHADSDADPLCVCVFCRDVCVCVCCPSVPSLPSWSAC